MSNGSMKRKETRMNTTPHVVRHSHRRVALLISVLALLLLPASVLATHDGNTPEKWPVYYEGQEITVMSGPSGNSQNPNQLPNYCFGPGPDFRENKNLAGTPIVYVLLVTGATQMYCPDGVSLRHDMVLTVAPGDPGYKPFVAFVYCFEDTNFDVAAMPYTSAAAVEAARTARALRCGQPYGAVQLEPVLGRQR
jgi:hypothetical protein